MVFNFSIVIYFSVREKVVDPEAQLDERIPAENEVSSSNLVRVVTG